LPWLEQVELMKSYWNSTLKQQTKQSKQINSSPKSDILSEIRFWVPTAREEEEDEGEKEEEEKEEKKESKSKKEKEVSNFEWREF